MEPIRPALLAVLLALPVLASAGDPATDSFDRMLAHTRNGATPPLPADAGTDPLVAAVVLPLLRAGHIQFASSPQRTGG